MLNLRPSNSPRCEGTFSRRALVRAGAVGLGGLTLAELFRAQARAAASGTGSSSSGGGLPTSDKSIIMLWLWGGPSHMETFDLKPQAPLEFRGEFSPIETNVPGIFICEHLPRLAQVADKFVLLRSLGHNSPGHVNSTHTMLSGYPGELLEQPPHTPGHPDVFAVAQRALAPRVAGAPQFVTLPYQRYQGSAYLGAGLEPMAVAGDPNDPKFQVPNLSLPAEHHARLGDRLTLSARFDRMRSQLDALASAHAIDQFHLQAAELLTSDRTREAFEISRESEAVRDRYGRHAVGQRCLLARRLVEAGVRLVTIDFPHVPGQRAFSWDDHASVWNIFEQMKIRLPVLDQVASALVEDLHERGLADDVLLVVMGEMSHTPRLSNFQGQPGREHWAQTMSVLMSGGRMRMGQVVGATNSRGDEPIERPLSPTDLQATWYRHLGVPLDLAFEDFRGRPTALLPSGAPIEELF